MRGDGSERRGCHSGTQVSLGLIVVDETGLKEGATTSVSTPSTPAHFKEPTPGSVGREGRSGDVAPRIIGAGGSSATRAVCHGSGRRRRIMVNCAVVVTVAGAGSPTSKDGGADPPTVGAFRERGGPGPPGLSPCCSGVRTGDPLSIGWGEEPHAASPYSSAASARSPGEI